MRVGSQLPAVLKLTVRANVEGSYSAPMYADGNEVVSLPSGVPAMNDMVMPLLVFDVSKPEGPSLS